MSFISRIVDFTFSTTLIKRRFSELLHPKVFNSETSTKIDDPYIFYTFNYLTKLSQFPDKPNKTDYYNKSEFNNKFKSCFDILLNEYKFKSVEITKRIDNYVDKTSHDQSYNFDNNIKTVSCQSYNNNTFFNLNDNIKLNSDFNAFHINETDNVIRLHISENKYYYESCYYPRYTKEVKNGIDYYDTTNITFTFIKN